jgi:hypothetical protein
VNRSVAEPYTASLSLLFVCRQTELPLAIAQPAWRSP